MKKIFIRWQWVIYLGELLKRDNPLTHWFSKSKGVSTVLCLKTRRVGLRVLDSCDDVNFYSDFSTFRRKLGDGGQGSSVFAGRVVGLYVRVRRCDEQLNPAVHEWLPNGADSVCAGFASQTSITVCPARNRRSSGIDAKFRLLVRRH